MRFLNRSENPNAVVGLFMLILLAIMAGPGTLPRLVSSLPSFEEGIPCDWLRKGEDRAHHQSLLARALSDRESPPISLEIRSQRLNLAQNTAAETPEPGVQPTPTTTTASLRVTIVVSNETLAPVPLLVTSNQVITYGQLMSNGPLIPNLYNNQSGLGISIYSDAAPLVDNPQELVEGAGYDENRIRVLGPRQICVHQANIPIENASIFAAQNLYIQAFYRNGNRGAISNGGEQQVFSDQGLWRGFIISEPYQINITSGR